MSVLSMSLWLFKCEKQPGAGEPQPLQTTPEWFRTQPGKSQERKQAFELVAKAETWLSELLLNLNHKDLFSFPSIVINLLFSFITHIIVVHI